MTRAFLLSQLSKIAYFSIQAYNLVIKIGN